MTEKKAIICGRCRRLITPDSQKCPYCGQAINSAGLSKLFPIGDIRFSFTKIIITANLIFFVLSYLLEFYVRSSIAPGSLFGALSSPSSIVFNLMGWADIRLIEQGHYWSLVTGAFLHGGILHIFFNMMWVKDLGPQIEAMFSPEKMFIIYILAGVGGNITAVYLPALARGVLSVPMNYQPVIGASGAVFGLMGAIIAFGKKRGGIFGRQMVRHFGVWAVIIIGMGFVFPNISNSAHIGGLASGCLVAWWILTQGSSLNGVFYRKSAIALVAVCLLSFVMMFMRLFQMLSGV